MLAGAIGVVAGAVLFLGMVGANTRNDDEGVGVSGSYARAMLPRIVDSETGAVVHEAESPPDELVGDARTKSLFRSLAKIMHLAG